VTNTGLHLKRIESSTELDPARTLAREFGDWATQQAREQLGVVIPTDADHPNEALDELLASGGRLYIAEFEGQPTGIGGLKRLSGTSAEIKRMFVRSTTRKRGVGRAILQQLINDAHELGCDTVYLESARFMTSAHALYQSAGFVPCDAYPGREFESVDDHNISLFMRLDLSHEHDVTVP
jgi:GNAT superfamily N-acetyltransferase